MVSVLSPMRCRKCGQLLEPDLTRTTAAVSFETCAYRCPTCRVAYSNARREAHRTLIWQTPELNVPVQVHGGLRSVLGGAVNVRNRPTKLARFCFETSEDAATWTVFRALQQQHRLHSVLGSEAFPGGDPAMLLWGVPAGGPGAVKVASALREVSAGLGESSRTEPDVVLVWDDLVVVVEVKLHSGNDKQPGHRGFDRYLDRQDLFSAAPAIVRAAGFYELVRNWRIGAGLAEARGARLELINVGPPAIAASAHEFHGLLADDSAHGFRFLTWSQLLRSPPPLPDWLRDYCQGKRLPVDGPEASTPSSPSPLA